MNAREQRLTPDEELCRVCSNCGLTWGAHRADPAREDCPCHEGHMDFDYGTVFEWSGEVREIEKGTPAKGLVA